MYVLRSEGIAHQLSATGAEARSTRQYNGYRGAFYANPGREGAGAFYYWRFATDREKSGLPESDSASGEYPLDHVDHFAGIPRRLRSLKVVLYSVDA